MSLSVFETKAFTASALMIMVKGLQSRYVCKGICIVNVLWTAGNTEVCNSVVTNLNSFVWT